MRVIYNNSLDPYFNQAAEEYLIDNSNESIFMLWRNENTVVIGKNQNAYAEVNSEFVKEHNIKVSRRLTGGGAVFHDKGNVNFTFIVPELEAKTLDFARFTAPIISALGELGVKAELSGRNDILAEGKKVSGNAQCVYHGKVMHHGTLLYCADMSKVQGALNVDPEKMKSKGIKSVRSRVANIADMIEKKLAVEEFISYLLERAQGRLQNFSDAEKTEIQNLAESKYSTWDWIWGKSKEYSVYNKKYYPYGLLEAGVAVSGGVIEQVSLQGDYFGVKDIAQLEEALCGLRYDIDVLKAALEKLNIEEYIMGAKPDDLISLLF